MPIVGGIFTALLVGLIVAFLSVKGIYIIGVFELVVGIILGFAVLQLIKVSNYAFYNHLSYLLIAMVFITYVSNQYFQYQIIIQKNDLGPFSFYDYLEERFHIGLTVNKMNTGWIGLLISWALQLVLTYYISSLKFVSGLNNYLLNRVPMEVVDFAYYHFVKENTEQQVRAELSKIGWSDSQNQDEVLKAIEAIGYAQELNRIQ